MKQMVSGSTVVSIFSTSAFAQGAWAAAAMRAVDEFLLSVRPKLVRRGRKTVGKNGPDRPGRPEAPHVPYLGLANAESVLPESSRPPLIILRNISEPWIPTELRRKR
jgi:hypothetical protein